MQKWTRPSNYMGEQFPEFWVIASQNRDSGTLDRSNFECITEALGGETETVIIQRASHWACGWVEFLMIHETDLGAVRKAKEIEETLREYPVVNEDHYNDLCYEEDQEIWQTCLDLSEKVALCKEAEISIFRARSETLPHHVSIAP